LQAKPISKTVNAVEKPIINRSEFIPGADNSPAAESTA